MSLRSTLAVILVFTVLSARGQEETELGSSLSSDSIRIMKGNKVIAIDSYAAQFDPRKALLYAAIFPGSGQVYNKKYWKVPLVYGGFAAGIYFVGAYQDLYLKYKNELYGILSDGSLISPTGYNEAQLRRLTNIYKRERDFFSIVTVFWYMLQLVDAHVDAHLKEFDVNPQLQVKLEPIIENSPVNGMSAGIALKFKF
ncbi:MAG TPA: DUF5683 domain-containing protein [Cyclobacteriaceae bacterium]